MLLPHFKFGNDGICTYCGDDSDTFDHVIPISFQSELLRSEIPNEVGPVTFACRDCNHRLGNRYFDTFNQRCEWIQQRLSLKTKAVNWTKLELVRLDWGLRKFIERERDRRLWIQDRADWFDSRSFWLNIEDLTWIELLKPFTLNFNKPLFEYFSNSISRISTVYIKR